MARKIPIGRIDKAAELISLGHTLVEISRIVGVNPDTISKKLRARGVNTSGGKYRPAKNRLNLPDDEIVTLYQSGTSENAIAKRFGTTRNSIRLRLNKAGVEIRTPSEAEKIKWAQMSDEQRANQISAAHNAVRGPRILKTNSRQKRQYVHLAGVGEPEFAAFLNRNGISFIHQFPIKRYKVDFLCGRVAVEITSTLYRYRTGNSAFMKRCKQLTDLDIATLAIEFDTVPALIHFGQDIITEIERLNRLEALPRQYWMIRCCRNGFTAIKRDGANLTSVLAPKQFIKSSKTIYYSVSD